MAHPGDRAAIIGADCPDLDGAILRSAFEALAHHDLVLGPTQDGGYYLIALSQPAPSLFHDIAWSTERVLAETMDRAAALGITTRMLETLDDLDTPADLARWIGTLAGGRRTEARHTLEALKTMGLVPPGAAAQE